MRRWRIAAVEVGTPYAVAVGSDAAVVVVVGVVMSLDAQHQNLDAVRVP